MSTLHKASSAAKSYTVSASSLLFRKCATAFLLGFLGVFLPAILNVLDKIATHANLSDFGRAFWISLIAGAIAAGLRALFALLPINLVQTDRLLTLGKKRADTVTITRRR